MLVQEPWLIAKPYRDNNGFTPAKNCERHFVPDLCDVIKAMIPRLLRGERIVWGGSA
jgi:hypothetical protein